MTSTILKNEGNILAKVRPAEQEIKGVVKIGTFISEGYKISVTFNDDGSQNIFITSPTQTTQENETKLTEVSSIVKHN